jgi:hypothetical protein
VLPYAGAAALVRAVSVEMPQMGVPLAVALGVDLFVLALGADARSQGARPTTAATLGGGTLVDFR